MDAQGKARRGQRSRQQIAVVDREPDLAAVARVKIGMRGEERLRFGGRRVAKAVDIMMAVAFGMGDADQDAHEREVLLHGEAGLAGQVFAGDEVLLAVRRSIWRRASR